MVEFSPEWYEAEVKKLKLTRTIMLIAAAVMLAVSPFYVIRLWPTIGVTENNAKTVTAYITDLREYAKEENTDYNYYEFDTDAGETYKIDWASYRDVMPYITANGYKSHLFTFKIDREGYVIQMSVEGRDFPLMKYENGYFRMNAKNMMKAFPAFIMIPLSGFMLFMSFGKKKQIKTYQGYLQNDEENSK